ncbi:MAG: hypothetical protein AABZ39_20455 [Spirochaetota bacterium]
MIRHLATFIGIAMLCSAGSTSDLVKAQTDLAKRLFADGRYRESLTEYDALTRVIDGPELYLAEFGKANSYFYLGDYQNARDEYARVYSNNYATYEFKLRSAYNLVMTAHAMHDAPGTDTWGDIFLRYYGNTPYAHYVSFYKGNVYFETEKYAPARTRFLEFLRLYPANDRTNEANWKLMVIDYLEKREQLLKLAEEIKILQKQVEEKEKEVIRREKEVEAKKKQLDEFEKQLNARSKQLDDREKQLNTREADLKAYEKKLNDQRAELKKLEDMLNGKKTLLDEKEKALKEAERILVEREKKFQDAVSKALSAAPTTTTTTTATTNVQKTTVTPVTTTLKPVTNTTTTTTTTTKPATNAAKKPILDDW